MFLAIWILSHFYLFNFCIITSKCQSRHLVNPASSECFPRSTCSTSWLIPGQAEPRSYFLSFTKKYFYLSTSNLLQQWTCCRLWVNYLNKFSQNSCGCTSPQSSSLESTGGEGTQIFIWRSDCASACGASPAGRRPLPSPHWQQGKLPHWFKCSKNC